MILCDTNIFISAFNKKAETIEQMEIIGLENLALSVITCMELYRGMSNKSEIIQMKKYLRYYDIIHISKQVSELAMNLVYDYHLSHNLQIPDSIIGATAIEYKLPLYTYNTKDFGYMPNLILYEI